MPPAEPAGAKSVTPQPEPSQSQFHSFLVLFRGPRVPRTTGGMPLASRRGAVSETSSPCSQRRSTPDVQACIRPKIMSCSEPDAEACSYNSACDFGVLLRLACTSA